MDNCILPYCGGDHSGQHCSSRDEQVLAFEDVNAQAPVHVLVIPKRHVAAVQNCGDGDQALLGQLLLTCAEVARARKTRLAPGYRIVTKYGRIVGRPCFISTCMCSAAGMAWPRVSGSPTLIDTCGPFVRLNGQLSIVEGIPPGIRPVGSLWALARTARVKA